MLWHQFLLRDIFSSIKFILFFKLISKPYYNKLTYIGTIYIKFFFKNVFRILGLFSELFPKCGGPLTHLSVVNLVIICRQLEHIFIKIDKELCFNLNNEILKKNESYLLMGVNIFDRFCMFVSTFNWHYAYDRLWFRLDRV